MVAIMHFSYHMLSAIQEAVHHLYTCHLCHLRPTPCVWNPRSKLVYLL